MESDGISAEWVNTLRCMHRVVEEGGTLPWVVRKLPGAREVGFGANAMLCPLETKREVVDLLAKAPVLAVLVDGIFRRLMSGDGESLRSLQDECRRAVGEKTPTPVGPWRLEGSRRCGVRSAILVSPESGIGFLPVEPKYVGDAVGETVANLAVAASVPELMAACLCLADDVSDLGPCRFAVDSVVANWRLAAVLMPARRRPRTFEGVKDKAAGRA